MDEGGANRTDREKRETMGCRQELDPHKIGFRHLFFPPKFRQDTSGWGAYFRRVVQPPTSFIRWFHNIFPSFYCRKKSGMIQSWWTVFVLSTSFGAQSRPTFPCKNSSGCSKYIAENSNGGETSCSFWCLFGDSRMVAGFNAALDVGRRFSFQSECYFREKNTASFNRQLEDLIRNWFLFLCFFRSHVTSWNGLRVFKPLQPRRGNYCESGYSFFGP